MHDIETPAPTAPKARRFTPYIAAWAALAAIAVLYLAVLAAKPEILARYWPASPAEGAPQANAGQRADVMTEVNTLKDRVNAMEKDVAGLKTDVEAQQTLAQSWETRISALEPKQDTTVADARVQSGPLKTVPAKAGKTGTPTLSAVPPQAQALAAATAQPAAPAATQQAAKQVVQQSLVDAVEAAAATGGDLPVADAGVAAQAAQQQPSNIKSVGGKSADLKVINAPPPPATPAAPALETGSVAPATGASQPVNFGPATVSSAQAKKPAGIVIGNGSSLDSLRLSWSLLADRHAATLGKLQPRYTTSVDANGLSYDLVAGPVKSVAEAKKLCKDLVAKAIACRVSDYAGDAL